MLRSSIVRLVDWCIRHAWLVILLTLALTAGSALYTVRHFAIATDITELFPHDLPWAHRALDYLKTFPPRGILVVVDAPTPEKTQLAATRLATVLAADREHFRSVQEIQGGRFFRQNGLLFLPAEQLNQMAGSMDSAAPLLENLSADPSLRGALSGLSVGLMGVATANYSLDAMTPALDAAADLASDALAGRPSHFSWQALARGKAPESGELRRFIQVEPVLDYTALEPGRAATDAVDNAARRLDLAGADQARVRMTGMVPMNDDEFGTIKEHAARNTILALVAVLAILWMALRSWRIILAAMISLACGVAMASALGLLLVKALNPISVAFFMLFIGLGIDFAIQFCVRYRAERHDTGALRPALLGAAAKAGGPLALAGAATALGFVAFVPTAYRGLGELGLIAGPGMIIAFLTSITILPALLTVLNPPNEARAMGFAALAPVDDFLQRHRIGVIVGTIGFVVLLSPLLVYLPFDFDPIHMRNPDVQSVATFLELRQDPQTGANAIEIVAPNLRDADATAQRLTALPEVAQTKTLSSLVPGDQDKKLALIRQMATAIGPSLNPDQVKPAPSDQENREALVSTAVNLSQFAALSAGSGARAANRLAGLLVDLAKADPAARQRVEAAIGPPLQVSLADLREALKAAPVTVNAIPSELKADWLAPDGRARVQVLPKGDPDDTAVLRKFVTAVMAVEPDATGPAVLLYETGNTIVHAFVEAAVFALVAIAILLWIALRRIADVLLTLVPLMLAAVVTLELCVVIDLPLNFANIIALPLLLGVGVAFKIYYIMAWRRGGTALVQSTLSRAVIFSAMTTATGFGSLWLSSHPGTSSMGKMMALALLSTMAAAVLFQPALMGPPRDKKSGEPPGGPNRSLFDDEIEADEPDGPRRPEPVGAPGLYPFSVYPDPERKQ